MMMMMMMMMSSCDLDEPTIWSHYTGQKKPCFNSFQLIITWMSTINDVPMEMVLFSYFSRYRTWRMDIRMDSHIRMDNPNF